jgi:hypothetical protein
MNEAFDVIDLNTERSHGTYDSLEEALGCIAYDHLRYWEIWRGNTLVAYRYRGMVLPAAQGLFQSSTRKK